MNHFIKFIILVSIVVGSFSCSDDFVNEELNVSGVATSAVIISPTWDAADYQLKCSGIKDGEFSIISKPDWLIVESSSVIFTDSIATIHASAKTDPRFSKLGFYIDQMMIVSGKRNYVIPVYYITEGTPAVQVTRTFNYSYNSYSNQLQIGNTGQGILLWDIVSIPNWLKVDMNTFNPRSVMIGQAASVSVPFTLNTASPMQGSVTGTIVLKTNDKNNPLVEITVTANLGKPSLTLYNDKVNFNSSETSKTFEIYNQGSGVLSWSFEDLPEWLSVSRASGMILPYYYAGNITFTCDRSKLQGVFNTATIKLKTNDANKSSVSIVVTARAAGISENVRELEGNIVRATFDKNTNLLYYITKDPSKLVAYDVTAKTVLREIALSKAPTCLTIKEDYKQALLGHSGMISMVDLTNFTVLKTVEVDQTVYDVEYAGDDWICYSIANSPYSKLMWKNISTGETVESTDITHVFGTVDLSKVPNQPYILASRTQYSPNGIFVFDINTRTQKSYNHLSLGKVWFYDGGEKIITNFSGIMQTSSVTSATGDVNHDPTIGQIKDGAYTCVTWWADYSASTNSIWTLLSDYQSTLESPIPATIYQFSSIDYRLVKKYTFDNVFQPTADIPACEVKAHYVFANSAGTELSVLRRGTSNLKWSIEFISVPSSAF